MYFHDSTVGLVVLVLVSLGCFFATTICVRRGIPKFIKAGVVGIDVNKHDRPTIPEALGLVGGTVYLVALVLLILVLFIDPQLEELVLRRKLNEYISAILSINCMMLLGFADDVLNLRWKYKLLFPVLSSLPALALYRLSNSTTSIKLPRLIETRLEMSYLDLGFLYYIFMVMVVVFCTNSINILAGINGIEAGQSLIIATSIMFNNLLQLQCGVYPGHVQNHLLSLVIIVPYIFTTLPLLWHNWYPASIFLGDTFCYFSGTVFALVGILGHFSKTLGLFFLPQIFNFVYSSPQLFHLIPCPRHRMPTLNPETGLLEMSLVAVVLSPCRHHPRNLLIRLLHRAGLVFVSPSTKETSQGRVVYINNLTLINLALFWWGPAKENVLAIRILGIQVALNLLGFLLRYQMVHLFY